MKIGWISNSNIRNRTGGQYDRLIKNVRAAKLDLLIINGNFTGQGFDFTQNLREAFSNYGFPVLFNLAPKDFQNTEVDIFKHLNNLVQWADSNKEDKFIHFSNVVLPIDNTILIGLDSWFDGLNLSKEVEIEEFGNILEFNSNKNFEDNVKYCADLSKAFAVELSERLEKAYEYKPKKILIFTPFGGSDLSMNFGGLNVVPKDVRGLYLNRFIYPSIKKLVSSNKKIRHVLIAGSPLGNNTNMISPNFKEVLCCSTAASKEGKKDIALHTLVI